MNLKELKESSSKKGHLEAWLTELNEKRGFLERCYVISLNRELKDLSDDIVSQFFEFFRATDFICSKREDKVIAVFNTAEIWCSLPEKVIDHLCTNFPIKLCTIEKSFKHKKHIVVEIVANFKVPKITDYPTPSDELTAAIAKEERLIGLLGDLEPMKIKFEFLLELDGGGFLVAKTFKDMLKQLDQNGLF